MTPNRLNYPPRQHVHFVGIGGSGMSGIAEVLLNLGYTVSGSDLQLSSVTERLRNLGAQVWEGHRAENLGDAQVVVTSTAVRSDNREVVAALERGLPVIPRAEMLAELMRLKYGVAVAGSHGKTTTTSMIASSLAAAGLDPTFVVGGRVNQAGASARLGKSELIVVEADESDRSFLLLAPVIAVVTSIDWEHMDCYRSLEDLQDAFVSFLNKVPFYGAAILCADDPNVRSLIPRLHRRVITYATGGDGDLRATDICLKGWKTEFTVEAGEEVLGRFRLPLPGIHNVRNALAAVAVARELNGPLDRVRRALGRFSGVGRRFEVRAKAGGVTLIDDYAHHPTEIRATLDAARSCGFKRLVVLFQPHRFTRTRDCWNQFLECFDGVDVLVLTEIYPASELPIAGITGRALAEAIRETGRSPVAFYEHMEEAMQAVLGQVQEGDALLTIGAGSVGRASEELATRLSVALGVANAH